MQDKILKFDQLKSFEFLLQRKKEKNTVSVAVEMTAIDDDEIIVDLLHG